MNPRRRVAVTGIGMVTPTGNDAPSTWAALQAGQSGAGPISTFDAGSFDTRIGAEVKDFDASSRVNNTKLLKYASRSHRFALAAATEALTDAGIQPNAGNSHRWGCSVGAGMMAVAFDELQSIHAVAAPDGDFNPSVLWSNDYQADPVAFCRSQTNTGIALLVQQFGIRGQSTAVHTACASGGQALGTALKMMRRGTVDYMLAGGFDSMLNPLGLSAFCLLGAVSTDNDTPERASRPFDLTRNGFVLGEGAGFLVLEDWDKAKARGAQIYAELAGDGNSVSSYRITDSPPDGDGPIQAINLALADAGITASDIDYVNAHGTSTPMNDKSECAALRAVMGAHIDDVAVSSTKSCMGHLIAAAGAVEAAVCVLAIRDGIAPVNANLTTLDPECNVNIVRDKSQPLRIRASMSNSLGFGGSNSSLIFRHPDEVEAAREQEGRA
jgi:3-oxoacyl-[acyl-carrier-protein] synthase II